MKTYKIWASMYLHHIFEYASSVTGNVSRNTYWLFRPQIKYGKRVCLCVQGAAEEQVLLMLPR